MDRNIPSNIEIHCNVRVRDLLEPEVDKKINLDVKNDRTIALWHVDYVLVEKETQKIVLAIELDDSFHNEPDKKKKDAWKDRILKESKVNSIRVPLNDIYNPSIIKKIIDSL